MYRLLITYEKHGRSDQVIAAQGCRQVGIDIAHSAQHTTA